MKKRLLRAVSLLAQTARLAAGKSGYGVFAEATSVSDTDTNCKRLANWIAALLAASSLFFCAVGISRSYTPLTRADVWDGIVEFALNVREGDIEAWWRPLKEHRPVLPRILYWVDFAQFGGNYIFLVAISLLLIASIWVVLVAFIRGRVDRENIFFASCISCAVTFAWMQAANLYTGINGSLWFMVMLFPLAAFYCLHRSINSPLWFASATVLGIASVWTMANGVFALPVMAAASAAIGLGWRRTAVLVALSAVCIATYFWDYRLPVTDTVSRQPMEIALFTLAFLGSPAFWCMFSWFAAIGHLWSVIVGEKGLLAIGGSFQEYPAAVHAGLLVASIAGVIFLITAIVATWRQLKDDRINSLQAVLLAFVAFIVMTAAAIALGRSSFGIEYAIQEQYQTAALLGWQALAIAVIRPKFDLGRSSILAVILAVALLPSELRALKSSQAGYGQLATALQAAQQGSASLQQLEMLGDPAIVVRVVDRLRKAGLRLIDRHER